MSVSVSPPYRCTPRLEPLTDGEPVILAETYTHDQYGNVITETHQSDLDPSPQSNNRITYTYDGLMRVLTAVRDDLDGNLIESTTYAYDAASNILSKVQQIAFTPTPTESTSGPTATQTIAAGACTGDCSGTGAVTVDDLMKGVSIALGLLPVDDCAVFDADADGEITIAELIVGVNNALNGCRLLAAH